MFRDPVRSWKSWRRRFIGCTIEVFINAYKNQLEIIRYILAKNPRFALLSRDGLDVVTIERNIKRMCAITHIPYTPDFIYWNRAPHALSMYLNVSEPTFFAKKYKGAQGEYGNPIRSMWSRTGLGLEFADRTPFDSLGRGELQKIEDAGLRETYEELCNVSKGQGFDFVL